MTQSPCVSDAIAEVAAMIKDGKLVHAKRLMAVLLDNVEPRVLALLTECGQILSRPSVVARPKLLNLWSKHQAHPVARKIIEACAPARDEWAARVVDLPETVPTKRDNTRPADPVDTRSTTPASRSDLRARRARARADRAADTYAEQRAGVD